MDKFTPQVMGPTVDEILDSIDTINKVLISESNWTPKVSVEFQDTMAHLLRELRHKMTSKILVPKGLELRETE